MIHVKNIEFYIKGSAKVWPLLTVSIQIFVVHLYFDLKVTHPKKIYGQLLM